MLDTGDPDASGTDGWPNITSHCDGECSSSSPGRVSRTSSQDQDSVTINSSKLNIKFWDGGFNPSTGLPQIDGDQIKVTIKPGSLPEEVPDSRLNALTLIGPFPLGDEFSIPLKAVKNVVTITSVSSGVHPYNTVRYGMDPTQVVEGVSSRGANLITVPSTGVGINSISFEVIVKPDINEKHIFEGELNDSGTAVGFHSRPDGVDPPTAQIRLNSDGTPVFGEGPNSRGIYIRAIDVRDPNTGEWIKKLPYSSFFPDSWSRSTVIEEIFKAFLDMDFLPQTKRPAVKVPTPNGFEIGIEYDKERNLIETAYPLFEGELI